MGINAARELGAERRPTPRKSHYYRVRMDVEDFYFGPFTVFGVSRNLSMTGVRVKVDRRVPAGATCRITFMDSIGRIRPSVVQAIARNVTKEIVEGRKLFEVGLEFDTPLEFMKRPGEL
jgi:hypothetical protein